MFKFTTAKYARNTPVHILLCTFGTFVQLWYFWPGS